MNVGVVLDVLLAAILVWLAWAALASRDLFRAIVLFIAFGLVLSMTWARLGAPDVALAEAAIGAGLTGALLLATWGRLRGRKAPDEQPSDEQSSDQQAPEQQAPGRQSSGQQSPDRQAPDQKAPGGSRDAD